MAALEWLAERMAGRLTAGLSAGVIGRACGVS